MTHYHIIYVLTYSFFLVFGHEFVVVPHPHGASDDFADVGDEHVHRLSHPVVVLAPRHVERLHQGWKMFKLQGGGGYKITSFWNLRP